MRATLLLLVFVLSCADSTPPTWPSQGDLELVEVGTHTAKLRWPAASDEEGVGGYRIRKEGAFLTEVGPDVTQAEIDGLDEAATVRLSVEAVDLAGNPSEPLYVEVTTQDGTPPRWPADATLTATPQGEGEGAALLLEWTEAEDNRAVTGYVVMRGSEVLGEPGADATSFRAEAPAEGLRVLAVDEAGNRSAPLSVRADTAVAGSAPEPEASQAPAEPAAAPASAPAIGARLSPAVQRSLKATTRLRHDRLFRGPAGTVRLQRVQEAASVR